MLDKLDLQVFESESLAIIGESGSGKSVLTKCIDGLLSFDTGSISFDKIDNIKKLSFLQMNKYMSKFGILFQNAALFDSLTIKENLMFANKTDNFSEILYDVSLPKSILHEFPSNLSIGVQKRIGLARAILQNPEILILDEPTNDLDLETLDLLQEVIAEYPGTVLLISHDRDFLNRTVETSIILTGQGKFLKIAGSWIDYQSLKIENTTPDTEKRKNIKSNLGETSNNQSTPKTRNSFVDNHRLEQLPILIERLEYEIKKLEIFLSDATLYLDYPVKFEKASTALIERQTELKSLEDEWFVLEERALNSGRH